jgi:hypothetical protein
MTRRNELAIIYVYGKTLKVYPFSAKMENKENSFLSLANAIN